MLSSLYLFFVSAAIPVGMFVWCLLKKRGMTISFILGALTFVVFQIMTRLPLIQLILPKTVWFTLLLVKSPVVYALFLGVTAALFEEGGRWAVMKLFMKDRLEWRHGVAFGMGHGGIEALLLVGLGSAAVLFGAGSAIPPSGMLWAGTERLSAMMLHTGWSLMVMESVRAKSPKWLLIAFALHAAVDFGTVALSYAGMPTATVELVLLAAGVSHIIFAVSRRKVWYASEGALKEQ